MLMCMRANSYAEEKWVRTIPAPSTRSVHSFVGSALGVGDGPAPPAARVTHFSAHVTHKNSADRNVHHDMSVHEGWGRVTAQLTAIAGGMR